MNLRFSTGGFRADAHNYSLTAERHSTQPWWDVKQWSFRSPCRTNQEGNWWVYVAWVRFEYAVRRRWAPHD